MAEVKIVYPKSVEKKVRGHLDILKRKLPVELAKGSDSEQAAQVRGTNYFAVLLGDDRVALARPLTKNEAARHAIGAQQAYYVADVSKASDLPGYRSLR